MTVQLKRVGKEKKNALHICVPGKQFAYCVVFVKYGHETNDGKVCEKCENIMRILLRKRYTHVREEGIQGTARARV